MTTQKEQLLSDIKEAMRARDKQRLDVLRLISAAIKQIEVDERIEVDDARMLTVLDKMVKQRQESIIHYKNASRDDLVAQEAFELTIIQHYLPAPLSEAEVLAIVNQAFSEIQVQGPSDMSKIMAYIKPSLQGRADMGKISQLVKTKLNEALG
jgi:uncharacterized protein YqeY